MEGFYRRVEHIEVHTNGSAISAPKENTDVTDSGVTEDTNDSPENLDSEEADEVSDEDVLEQQHCEQMQNVVAYKFVFSQIAFIKASKNPKKQYFAITNHFLSFEVISLIL